MKPNRCWSCHNAGKLKRRNKAIWLCPICWKIDKHFGKELTALLKRMFNLCGFKIPPNV